MGRMDYFPAFFKYRATLDGLTDAQVGRVFRAALAYAEDGTVPELKSAEKLAFAFIRADIDTAREKYDETCRKRKTAAVARWKNGRMQMDANACFALQTDANDAKTKQNKTKQNNSPSGGVPRARAHEGDDNNPADTADGGVRPGTAEDGKGAVRRGASETEGNGACPPTLDEVEAYCASEGLCHVDPRRFWLHYDGAGWMSGGRPVSNWKSVIRKWDMEDAEKARRQTGIQGADVPETSFDTSEFFEAAVARTYAEYEAQSK